MYRLRSALVWVRRIRHCRGFGIQSPWVYNFVRYVINEHDSYYAYDELERKVQGIDKKTRKLCKLYFRISNYSRASVFIDFATSTDAFKQYVEAGCRHTRVINLYGDGTADKYHEALDRCGMIEVVRITPNGNWKEFYRQIRNMATNGTMIIIEGIKRDGDAKRLWKEILTDNGCTITLDLYSCGIIYFDKKRYKQNYIINF